MAVEKVKAAKRVIDGTIKPYWSQVNPSYVRQAVTAGLAELLRRGRITMARLTPQGQALRDAEIISRAEAIRAAGR